MNKLNFTSLENAILSLREALEEHGKDASNGFVRDCCIQRFEYSYELSYKMLKRYLEQTSIAPVEIDYMSMQEIIRLSAEKGLVQHSWDKWHIYRMARNTTSHAYNQSKAAEVMLIIPEFYEEAVYLCNKLMERNS